jgi:gamma-glutamyltranspeptidase/glutathione hydrolase
MLQARVCSGTQGTANRDFSPDRSLSVSNQASTDIVGLMSAFDWNLPYTSQREPINARNMVATSSPMAAQAGLSILRKGGNAADAAVATAACMTVLEPTSNGIGGDAFALIWDGDRIQGLNGSGRSPKAIDAERLLQMDAFPRVGWDPVTVPGCVQAWVDMNTRYGALDLAECLEPAITYARDGYLVPPQTARLWARASRVFKAFEAWSDTFLFDGEPPKAGQFIRLPDHADTLESIANSGGASFYRGELATRIANAAREAGAVMTESDLAEHQSLWVDPISIDYRGMTLNEIPPNGQGIAALIALGILRHFKLSEMTVDSTEVLHLQIEAMKLGFADAHRHVADPDSLQTTCEALLSDARLEKLAARIDPEQAQVFDTGIPRPGGTILLTTADQDGRCVSWIQSNYSGFGSGIVIPGTGIAMQNRGACFNLTPGHPNVVAPEKRPYHTIIPAMTTPGPGGKPTDLIAFGVMGGFMQPQGHLQVLSRMHDFNQNPQAALDGPRWQWTAGRAIKIEPGFSESTIEGLKALGHQLSLQEARSSSFGRGQVIRRLDHGWCAGSDLRADGQAAGF